MWLYPEIKIVSDLVGYHALQSPGKAAFIAGDVTLSFGELHESTDGIATALVQNLPERANIGFIGKNSIAQWQLLFAAIKAGCTWLPLNWRLAPAELSAIIAEAGCPLVFVESSYAPMMEEVRGSASQTFEIVCFDPGASALAVLQSGPLRRRGMGRDIRIAPDDAAFLLYTSGTTGKPKGVLLSHQAINFQRLCEELDGRLEWRADDILLMAMPNFHLLGLNNSLMALYRGCTIALLPAWDTTQALRAFRNERPTITALVPTAIQMLLDHPDARPDTFTSLRLIIYGGSSIGKETLRRALDEMKCEFAQHYGITETSGPVMMLGPDQHRVDEEDKLKSCGRPFPLMQVRIVDASGTEVETGVIGELMIRTPALFEGYWKNPRATAEALDGAWYRSGDAGYRDADGLFYVVDRIKDMIVTGGENVYSSEVEQALAKHGSVNAVAAVGVPDPRWGDKVVAVVVLRAGAQATAEELIAHCRTLIAGFKVPKEIHFAASLPLSGAGKILKRTLRDQLTQAVRRTGA